MNKLIADEFLKLRTIRSPWLLLVAAQVVVIAGISGAMSRGDAQLAATTSKALGHIGLASLFTLILGITAVAGEYRHKTITDTFLSTPRRGRVIWAKAAAYSVIGVVFGVITGVTALIATYAWLAAKGGSLDMSDADVWRTLLGGIAWDAAFAAVGVGVGALVRNLTGAIIAALAWLALVEGIVSQLVGDLGKWLPFRAGSALANTSAMDGRVGLAQWEAGLLLIAYAALFTFLAIFTTIRRDVT